MSGLFGDREVVVGKPQSDLWKDRINAEQEDPANAAPCTGGPILSYREHIAIHGLPGVRHHHPRGDKVDEVIGTVTSPITAPTADLMDAIGFTGCLKLVGVVLLLALLGLAALR